MILYELDEMWKFTLFWTLILYGLFHLGAVGVAVLMQGGRRMSSWKYLWLVPLTYALIAGFEGLLAGTLVGLMYVWLCFAPMSVAVSVCMGLPADHPPTRRVGASYLVGDFNMSTWIPFVWGWVNVMVLIVSSFRIQGGL